MKKLILIFAVIFVYFNSTAYAEFPSSNYPTGNHPRLWLTPERIAAINTLKNQNNERWQEFKNLCDSLIDSDTSNDPWNLTESPQHYTAPLALMYQITKDNRYADKALELVYKTSTDYSKYGDPDHENYYFLGLTYDWLYNYKGMTNSRKTALRAKIKTISDKFWQEFNLSASGTDSDQNLLTGLTHLVSGVAIYGDSPDAITLLNRGWQGWKTGYYTDSGISNSDLIRSAIGGAYFTGAAYFPSTDIIGISGYLMTLSSACNYDIASKEPDLKPFWSNIIRSFIHLTNPLRTKIYPYGSWQDPNILANQPWLQRAMIISSYFADKYGYAYEAALAKGFANEVDLGDFNDSMLELFYTNPGVEKISPYGENALPVVRFTKNPDFLFFRNNWSKNANWGIFAGDGSIPFDHQNPDHGSFALWRGGSYLTRSVRTYEGMMHGDFFNTVSIENNCRVNGIDCSGTALFNSKGKAIISRHREQIGEPLFAYAMLNADNQWDDLENDNVITYRRHFFWSGDYVVIFDRIRTKNPVRIKYRLRALTEPIINGNTVSQLSKDNKQKLMQRTLEPSQITINKINETDEWKSIEDWVVNYSERKWQTVINFDNKTDLNILNVIKTGPATMTGFGNIEHIKTDDNTGVRIDNRIVLFSPGENLRSTLNYTIHNSSANMWHLIADLNPGTYDIIQNGKKIYTINVSDNDNTALFKTNDVSESLNISIVKNITRNKPSPGIKINMLSKQTYKIGISMDAAGITSGVDWWLLHLTPGNKIEYFDINTMSFKQGLKPLIQGDLIGFSEIYTPTLNFSESGNHIFLFGADLNKNSVPDLNSIFYKIKYVNNNL